MVIKQFSQTDKKEGTDESEANLIFRQVSFLGCPRNAGQQEKFPKDRKGVS
jgi:hypothetical protein